MGGTSRATVFSSLEPQARAISQPITSTTRGASVIGSGIQRTSCTLYDYSGTTTRGSWFRSNPGPLSELEFRNKKEFRGSAMAALVFEVRCASSYPVQYRLDLCAESRRSRFPHDQPHAPDPCIVTCNQCHTPYSSARFVTASTTLSTSTLLRGIRCGPSHSTTVVVPAAQ